jgi:hypothetical protein
MSVHRHNITKELNDGLFLKKERKKEVANKTF